MLLPQPVFFTSFGIRAASDFALVFVGVIWLVNFRQNFATFRSDRYAKVIILFLSFIIIDMIYSFVIKGYELASVVRQSRNYFFLLAYFIIVNLRWDDLVWIAKFILVVTLCQSLIYLAQIPVGYTLLREVGREGVEYSGAAGDLVRYEDFPDFLYPCLFFGWASFLAHRRKSLSLALFFTSSLGSLLPRWTEGVLLLSGSAYVYPQLWRGGYHLRR